MTQPETQDGMIIILHEMYITCSNRREIHHVEKISFKEWYHSMRVGAWEEWRNEPKLTSELKEN